MENAIKFALWLSDNMYENMYQDVEGDGKTWVSYADDGDRRVVGCKRIVQDGQSSLERWGGSRFHGRLHIHACLIGIFSNNQAKSIQIIINEASEALEKHLSETTYAVPVQVVKKSTPSSLHSFYELLKANPDIDELCLTTTDTVFTEDINGPTHTDNNGRSLQYGSTI